MSDTMLVDCLVQACAHLLEKGEAIIVSPPSAGGRMLYVWYDEETTALKISEVQEGDQMFQDAGMQKLIGVSDYKIGQRIWLHDKLTH